MVEGFDASHQTFNLLRTANHHESSFDRNCKQAEKHSPSETEHPWVHAHGNVGRDIDRRDTRRDCRSRYRTRKVRGEKISLLKQSPSNWSRHDDARCR